MSKKYKVKIMKTIIDALKEKCHSVEDFKGLVKKELPKLSPDALRKRVTRYLNELEILGLVEERSDKYCWYTYESLFKGREDYSAKLKHSRDLIPALREIAKITRGRKYLLSEEKEEYMSQEYMKVLVEGAKSHLKSYPEIWKLLNRWKEKEDKASREREMFTGCLMERLRGKFGKLVEPSKSFRLTSFVGNNIPLLIYAQIRYNYQSQLQIKNEEIWFGGNLVAKGKHLYRKIDEFIKREREDESNIKTIKQIEKIENKAFEIRRTLQQEMRKLILKIESGEPLLGGCETCPKIYFSDNSA